MSNYSDPITATGSLITFDAPSGGIFDSLSVPITPTQDLHGYDHPWPAGGGVNKYDVSNWEYREYTTRRFWGTNSPSMVSALNALPAGTYTITAKIKIDALTDTSGNRTYGFLCTGVSVDGRQTIATPAVGTVVSVSKTFTLSSAQAGTFTHCYWYAGTSSSTSDTATISEIGINVGSDDTYYPYENICPISGLTGLSVYVSPTQDPDDATTYNVDWSAQAGTVYHGTVDVVTGQLTVDRASVDLGSLTWGKYSTTFFYATLTPIAIGTNNILCSQYKPVATSNDGTFRDLVDDCVVNTYIGGHGVRVKDSTKSSLSTTNFKTAMSGVQLVYELATPITYQLTPTQISALVGSNNVWVDTSAIITLIYRLLQVDRQTGRTSIGKRAESLDVLGKFSSISKVEVNVTETLFYEAGDSSGRTLTVDCPFGTQEMADNLLAMLRGFYYQPYEARKAILDPAFEIGDGVTVGNVYGGIFSIHQKCGPLHLADLSAPADEEIDHEYKFTPAAERKIERRLNNMESELSVQAGEISAKVDRQGGDPSSVSWLMDSDVFKVAVDGSDVLTVDENGLTVNGDGTFTGSVQAKNIRYGGSSGTFSGGGISGGSIGTSKFTSGINTSLGNADYAADVFSGAVQANYGKFYHLYAGSFVYGNQTVGKRKASTAVAGDMYVLCVL